MKHDPCTGSCCETYLTDLSPKDKPWDVNKALAGKLKHLYKDTVFDVFAGRIDGCSGSLEFYRITDPETGEVRHKLKSCRFCRVRHCPICQWRRSVMWVARFLKAVPCMTRDYPTARFIYVTLTVKNCELTELRSTLTCMNTAWKRLIQRKQWPGLGFVRSTEVTRAWDWYDKTQFIGRHGDTWAWKWRKDNPGKHLTRKPTTEVHPHFHALVMVPAGYFKGGNYLNQADWTDYWKSCLQVEYTPIVDVRTVKPNPKLVEAGELSKDQALVSAIVETFKYSVKPSDLLGDETEIDREWLVEVTNQLNKTRAIALGGIPKNYIKESEPEDLITEGQDLAEVAEASTLWFGWREYYQRYVKFDRE